MALESMTLPSRLKPINGRHSMLSQMETALNTNSHQKIAKLQCNITDPETAQNRHVPSGRVATKDQRLPTTGRDIANTADVPEKDGLELPNAGHPAFDMDLLPGEDEIYGTKVNKAHIFGQVETFRGDSQPKGAQEDDESGLGRKRRRIAGLPNIETYVVRISLRRYTIALVVICTCSAQWLASAFMLGRFCHPKDRASKSFALTNS